MDIAYLLFLQNLREVTGGVFNGFLSFVTHLGENEYLILIFALIYWCFNKKMGQRVWFSFGFGLVLNGLLKLIACVYRPWIRDARIEPLDGAKTTATGYSFPSGHSTNASSGMGSLAYNNRKNKKIMWSLIVLIALVLLSRNWLGVHTPQDVIVGLGCGLLCFALSELVLRWESKKEGRDLIVVVAGTILIVLYLIFIMNKSYPIDYDAAGNILVDPQKMMVDSFQGAGIFLGLLYGWLLEKRFVRFEVPESAEGKITLFLPGIIVTYILFYIGTALVRNLFGSATGNIIGMFLVTFFVIGLYPYLFTKVAKK